METKLVTASELAPDKLDQFLRHFFHNGKCDLLTEHGAWWHNGDHNRWVILIDDQVAGYCAVIPTTMWINQKESPAVWWVDIIVAPEFRGKGLQSIFDRKIQDSVSLKLGFPNEVAARIHKKHGWGVRDDFFVRLLPLHPLKVGQVQKASGAKGFLLKLIAFLLTPIMWSYRTFINHLPNKNVRVIDHPDPLILSGIFERYKGQNIATTLRDKEYFHHRFLSSPLLKEYKFFIRYDRGLPTHFLISRYVIRENIVVTRILDVFGDFTDSKGLRQILLAAISDASRKNASQVTVLSSLTFLSKILIKLGFIPRSTVRFCWQSASEYLMSDLAGPLYVTLADSDNDEVD